MSKKEFLDILYGQLIDQMPSDKASSHTRYYQDYIEAEIRRGRSQEEVLQSLGDPRLIAKTLIDTEADASCSGNSQDSFHSGQNSYDSGQTGSASGSYSSRSGQVKHHRVDLSTWYGKAIVILAAAAVLIFLFMVLSFLIPIILVVFAVTFLIAQFRKRR